MGTSYQRLLKETQTNLKNKTMKTMKNNLIINRKDLINIINEVCDHKSAPDISFVFSQADILRFIKDGIEKEYNEFKENNNSLFVGITCSGTSILKDNLDGTCSVIDINLDE